MYAVKQLSTLPLTSPLPPRSAHQSLRPCSRRHSDKFVTVRLWNIDIGRRGDGDWEGCRGTDQELWSVRRAEVRRSLMDYSQDKHQIFKVWRWLPFFLTWHFMFRVNILTSATFAAPSGLSQLWQLFSGMCSQDLDAKGSRKPPLSRPSCF